MSLPAYIDLEVIPTFPARIVATGGLSVTRTNGVYTFSLDIDTLNDNLNPTPETNVLTETGGVHAKTPFSAFPLSEVAEEALAGKAPLVHTHVANDISDSTNAGRSLLTAPDAAAQVAFLPLATTSAKGLAPILSNSTTHYLRGDGSYAAIPAASNLAPGLLTQLTGSATDVLLGDGSFGPPPVTAAQAGRFATRAAALAANVISVVAAITIYGYTTTGDMPPANYVRVVSEPTHPGKIQTADGQWWDRVDADRYPEQNGAVGNGTTDDTAAVQNWLSELQLDTRATGRLLGGRQYRITSQMADITRQITIDGPGFALSGFLRDYNGTARKGLLHLTGASVSQGASNSRLSGFYILAAAGTTGGALLSGISTADYTLTGVACEDIWITTLGTNTHANTIDFDGTPRITGAIGTRDNVFRNVHAFGANGFSIYFAGLVGLSWHGGGVYPAGGSPAASGGMQITGTATVKTQNITIDIYTSGGLSLTQMAGSNKIGVNNIGAISGVSINNDGTCANTGVYGLPSGTVVGNWVASGIRRPGAAFSVT